MQMFEIMRPVHFNDGKLIDAATHRAWEDSVLSLAGGFTVMPEARGAWRDPANGRVYREPMSPVRVACLPNVARCIAEMTKRHYRQEAVLLYPVAENVEFV